jgi:RimJ/RimL family protein N-acetyltransferase
MHVYEAAGYKREGIFRDAVFRDGSYHDCHRMAMLAPEWKAHTAKG